MTYSDACTALVKEFESCELTAYRDPGKRVWTIGWGHTGLDVNQGLSITQERADFLMEADLATAARAVERYSVGVTLNQNQFDALTDFIYNLGAHNYLLSTLRLCVLRGDFAGAAEQFLLWDHVGKLEVAGLERRRVAERALFIGPPAPSV